MLTNQLPCNIDYSSDATELKKKSKQWIN